MNYHKTTSRYVKIIEAYFINELNSSLNSQKSVYLPLEPLESVLPFVNISNRDSSVPIFIYGPKELFIYLILKLHYIMGFIYIEIL